MDRFHFFYSFVSFVFFSDTEKIGIAGDVSTVGQIQISSI
jgi:hypothetical protein